jgi:hypothetical protein
MTTTYQFQGVNVTKTATDVGSTDFGFVDLKGRACGYSWNIVQVVHDQPISVLLDGKPAHLAAGEVFFELRSNPTRNGHHYGPSTVRVLCRTLEKARRIAIRRADASRKRDTKKFCK